MALVRKKIVFPFSVFGLKLGTTADGQSLPLKYNQVPSFLGKASFDKNLLKVLSQFSPRQASELS